MSQSVTRAVAADHAPACERVKRAEERARVRGGEGRQVGHRSTHEDERERESAQVVVGSGRRYEYI